MSVIIKKLTITLNHHYSKNDAGYKTLCEDG